MLFLLFLAFGLVTCNFFDHSSFLVRELSYLTKNAADTVFIDSPKLSIELYRKSFEYLPSFVVAEKLQWIYEMLGNTSESTLWKMKASENDHYNILRIRLYGLNTYSQRNYKTAIKYFDSILASFPDDVETLFLKALCLQLSDDTQLASITYDHLIRLNPFDVKSYVNLAALHQKFGSSDHAIPFHKKGLAAIEVFKSLREEGLLFILPDFVNLKHNLALAYNQKKMYHQAYNETISLFQHLNLLMDATKASMDTNLLDKSHNSAINYLQNQISLVEGTLLRIQRSSCFWKNWEILEFSSVLTTMKLISYSGSFHGPVEPFDTILMPVNSTVRREIAKAGCRVLHEIYDSRRIHNVGRNSMLIKDRRESKLRLGFISFDFNNHPTGHLVEAIFRIVVSNRNGFGITIYDKVELIVYNYGKNDNSSFRHAFEELSDEFYDIVQLSNENAAEKIKNDNIDILIDLQVHTMGNRLEITALKPLH